MIQRLSRLGLVLALSGLVLGCASDLLVRAPAKLPPGDVGRLGALAPLRIAVGAVADVPDMRAPVGERGPATLQAGGPIRLTEDAGTILRRAIVQTLERAGHRVVEEDADAYVALRYEELSVDAPREGLGWQVTVRARVALRVSPNPGDESWDEISASAARSMRTAWRPDIGTVEPVLSGCLGDLTSLLARRKELAAALTKHAAAERAG